jgi:hypothetical protein
MMLVKTTGGGARLRIWICTAILMLSSAAASAAEILMECPATDHAPKIALRFDADVLSVTDARGTAALTGSLQNIRPGMFGIKGSGPMDAMMPDPGALDDCLIARLKQQDASATDASALTYVANLCRGKLLPAGRVQKVEAEFTATALDPAKATLFIQRRYMVASKVTGKPMQLDEFPPRNCDIVKGP